MSKNDETVTTHSDGFGRWYATVTLDGGYGDYLAVRWGAIRQKARRAIRREILAREAGPIAPVRIEVSDQYIDGNNVWYSVTFREV